MAEFGLLIFFGPGDPANDKHLKPRGLPENNQKLKLDHHPIITKNKQSFLK